VKARNIGLRPPFPEGFQIAGALFLPLRIDQSMMLFKGDGNALLGAACCRTRERRDDLLAILLAIGVKTDRELRKQLRTNGL